MGTKRLVLEARQLVAHARRLLEFEVARVFQHLLLQALDLAGNVFLGHVLHARALQRRFHLACEVSGAGSGPLRQKTGVDQAIVAFGVAERLVAEVRRIEQERGVRWLEADFDLSQEGVSEMLLDLGFIPVVPPLKTRIEPWEYDREMYKRRNEVERLFRRLKGYRRIFSRFEKLDLMFLGFISFVLVADGLRMCQQTLVHLQGDPRARA